MDINPRVPNEPPYWEHGDKQEKLQPGQDVFERPCLPEVSQNKIKTTKSDKERNEIMKIALSAQLLGDIPKTIEINTPILSIIGRLFLEVGHEKRKP